ncbi:DUF6299 family protein [Streptomyces sp. NPDC006703]|uniref:DUF6299 family protein n=1 Tax=Streptomyces sp. NPDC006703 TaxID=3364759 RepID=UPI0036A7E301
MRVSLVAAGVVAAAGALLGAAAVPAGAATSGAATSGSVSANPTGTVSADGTVTLSGTYRCSSPADPGPVFVASTVRTGSVGHGIGGTSATCDGAEHTWVNRENPSSEPPVKAGPATIEVTLFQLNLRTGLPLPVIFATDRHGLDLRATD